MDIKKLSDKDLEAISRGDFASVSEEGLRAIAEPKGVSDEEANQIVRQQGIPTPYGNITQKGVAQAAGMAADVGIEAAGATLGQAAGAPFAPVTFGASVPAGGFVGGTVGNAASQVRQMVAGERKKFSVPEAVGAGIASMVPGGQFAKAGGKAVTTLSKEAAKQISANVAGIVTEDVMAGRPLDAARITIAAAGAAGGAKAAQAMDTAAVVKKAAKKAIDAAVQQKTLDEARKAGYVILPSAMKHAGAVNEALEYIGGKAQTLDEINTINDSVTKALAKRAIGIPVDEVLDLDAIYKVRKQAGDVYGEIGRVVPSAKTSIAKFQEARDKARAYWLEHDRAGTVASLNDAKRWDKVAESQLGRIKADIKNVTGSEDLYKSFESARKLIAKTHVIEDAFETGSGIVKADIIAKRRAQGKNITTEELEVISNFAEAFPRSADNKPERLVSRAIVHPLMVGTAYGVGTTMGGPQVGAAAMASMLFAPPAVRAFLKSGPYQALASTPRGTPVPQDFLARMGQYSGSSAGRVNQENAQMPAVAQFMAQGGY